MTAAPHEIGRVPMVGALSAVCDVVPPLTGRAGNGAVSFSETLAEIFPQPLTDEQRTTLAEARYYSGVVVLAAPRLFTRSAQT